MGMYLKGNGNVVPEKYREISLKTLKKPAKRPPLLSVL
jgi:hypothetical protein